MADYLVPRPIRLAVQLAFHSLFTPFSSRSTIVLDEYSGTTRSLLYAAAEVYLGTKIKAHYETSKRKDCSVVDTFDNFQLKWRRCSSGKKRFFELSFNKKFKDRIMNEYLPFVYAKAREIKGQFLFSEDEELDGTSGKSLCQNKGGIRRNSKELLSRNKVRNQIAKQLFSRNKISKEFADCPCHICVRRRGRNWGSNDIRNTTTFETMAVDTKPKEAVGIGDTDWKVKMPNLRTTIKAWKPYRFPKSDDKVSYLFRQRLSPVLGQ